jgi:hypothetical protein
MIKRRNTKETIITGLEMMFLFHNSGLSETEVFMEDSLREAGSTAGEVYSGVIVVGDRNIGFRTGAVISEDMVGIGERRGIITDENEVDVVEFVGNRFESADKFFAEEDGRNVG